MTTTAAPPSAAPTPPTPAKRTSVWAKILLVVLVLVVAAAAAFAGLTVGKFLGAGEERDVQVVRSVTGEEQVILVTAGLTDIQEESDSQTFFGLFDIPLSDRTAFLRYEFDAKLGIDGRQVEIEPLGDKRYRITIPEFMFLGYDNPDFSVATEANGILSWTTPEIDILEATEELLTDAAVAEHIEGLRPLLEEQAVTFYTRIVSSIEPDATLEFEFTP
ncbi:hypothetical protein ACFWN7_05720 [Agromyces sp. NPDC058484]|uniref:hypothetical protein n=1 Tax=Agromyces sp. NPDC058484 TaxID=3346524 RepID=UPI0036569CA2